MPYTTWYNYKPDLSFVLVFGTKSFVFRYRPTSTANKKFLPRSIYKTLIEMKRQHTLYRIFIFSTSRVQNCRRKNIPFWIQILPYHQSNHWYQIFQNNKALTNKKKLKETKQLRKHLANVCFHITVKKLYMRITKGMKTFLDYFRKHAKTMCGQKKLKRNTSHR